MFKSEYHRFILRKNQKDLVGAAKKQIKNFKRLAIKYKIRIEKNGDGTVYSFRLYVFNTESRFFSDKSVRIFCHTDDISSHFTRNGKVLYHNDLFISNIFNSQETFVTDQ